MWKYTNFNKTILWKQQKSYLKEGVVNVWFISDKSEALTLTITIARHVAASLQVICDSITVKPMEPEMSSAMKNLLPVGSTAVKLL